MPMGGWIRGLSLNADYHVATTLVATLSNGVLRACNRKANQRVFLMLSNLLEQYWSFGPPPLPPNNFYFYFYFLLCLKAIKGSHSISSVIFNMILTALMTLMIYSCVPWYLMLIYGRSFMSDHFRPLWPATQPVGGIFPKCSWCESVTKIYNYVFASPSDGKVGKGPFGQVAW